ncbi:hypothetical protein BD289DRAFT_422868 [Coniella lustricola]|uniref:Secreted protein n=1 Tax=Coniella lustricola TaxID=2025994 RepID=A0A2T3AKL5_9PEZI|nr:hypothetical protein BD289DRAFT_422868 [Coniella lustricola]
MAYRTAPTRITMVRVMMMMMLLLLDVMRTTATIKVGQWLAAVITRAGRWARENSRARLQLSHGLDDHGRLEQTQMHHIPSPRRQGTREEEI